MARGVGRGARGCSGGPHVGTGLGKPAPGAGAKAGRARALQPSARARPPAHRGDRGSEPEAEGGAAGQDGEEAARERRGLDLGL